MTDTIKRIAGPTQPAQTTAGTLLYTAGGSTVTAVKSALIHNTDPLMGAFFTMAIGSSLTDLSKRVLSSYYVAPGDTAYVPLDLVLGNSETLYARQSCMINPADLTIAAAVAATNAGSGTSIVSASWTEAVGDIFLLTVVLVDAGATAVVSSFTDSHNLTWALLQSHVNADATMRIYQYIAICSGGTTNATTTVTFDSTCDSSALAIDKITALTSTVEGNTGATGFRALSMGDTFSVTQPLMVSKEMGANVFNHHAAGAAGETQTVAAGWTEVDDFGTTNAATISSAYLLAPAACVRPTVVTGSKRVHAFAEILNTKRSITVTLDGVEVT